MKENFNFKTVSCLSLKFLKKIESDFKIMRMVSPGSAPLFLASLQERPDLRKSYFGFIEKYFPRGAELQKKTPIKNEFCLLLAPSNLNQVYCLLHEGQIAATGAFRIFEFENQNFSKISIAALGHIVTHPKKRNRGFSRLMISHLEKEAQKRGAALTVLWSDLYDFYVKRGYLLGEKEIQWTIKREDLLKKKWGSEGVRPAQSSDLKLLQRSYESLKIGPRRDFKDYEKFLFLPDTSIQIFSEPDSLWAYAVWGKARDLRHTLHEIQASPNIAKKLLFSFAEKNQTANLKIQLPPCHPLKNFLEEEFGLWQETAMGFFKILDPEKLINFLNPPLQEITGCHLNLTQQNFQIFNPQKELIFESSDPSHLVQIFLSPFPLEELEGLEARVSEALKNWTGAGLYFWGLDSV